MTRDELASQICIKGPEHVHQIVSGGPAMIAAAIGEAIDLTDWTAHVTKGMTLFARDDERVLVVNASIEQVERYRSQMDEYPDSILIMRDETDDAPADVTESTRWRRA